jgi:hypothetical protein
MSSGTSTSTVADEVRLKPDSTNDSRGDRADGDDVRGGGGDVRGSLQPWQLFVLAALACATAAMFLTRAQGVSGVLLLSVLIGTAALVGLTSLLAVRPLVSDIDDRTRVVGQRTREGLEREKMLALRALKELEFDRAMGKLSDADVQEMSTRLRARATRLMRQLDAGDSYRARIERDLAQRLSQAPDGSDAGGNVRLKPDATARGGAVPQQPGAKACDACATLNDTDARFCKECGEKL